MKYALPPLRVVRADAASLCLILVIDASAIPTPAGRPTGTRTAATKLINPTKLPITAPTDRWMSSCLSSYYPMTKLQAAREGARRPNGSSAARASA